MSQRDSHPKRVTCQISLRLGVRGGQSRTDMMSSLQMKRLNQLVHTPFVLKMSMQFKYYTRTGGSALRRIVQIKKVIASLYTNKT